MNQASSVENDARLTDAEWREFQNIPDQGYSHRAWIDARIAERLARAFDQGVLAMSRALQGGDEPVNPYRPIPPVDGSTNV